MRAKMVSAWQKMEWAWPSFRITLAVVAATYLIRIWVGFLTSSDKIQPVHIGIMIGLCVAVLIISTRFIELLISLVIGGTVMMMWMLNGMLAPALWFFGLPVSFWLLICPILAIREAQRASQNLASDIKEVAATVERKRAAVAQAYWLLIIQLVVYEIVSISASIQSLAHQVIQSGRH